MGDSRIRNLRFPEFRSRRITLRSLLKLLASPTIASKNWVYRQYDHMVQDRTVVLPGSDAAVIRLNEANKFIAFTTDCNATYCYLDPFEGGKIAVAEAARNLVCSGARPLAITNCLNFGNPMKPEIFWQFRRCVEGVSEACRIFGTPVTGGNVSFYNESRQRGIGIDPTPVIGMLGLIDDARHITTQWFKEGWRRSTPARRMLAGNSVAANTGSGFTDSRKARRPEWIWRTPRGCTTLCWKLSGTVGCAAPTIAARADWRWRWRNVA